MAQASASTPVWIDTDPALGIFLHDSDDIFALWTALDSQQLQVRGISLVRGNVSVEKGREIASGFLRQRLPAKNPPLHPGVFPGGPSPSAAATALHAALQKERLTLLALGPLTNLAELLRHWPGDARRIERLVCLGGEWPGTSIQVDGVPLYRFHDSNFSKNPSAFLEVLRHPLRVDLIPIDLAKNLTLTVSDFQRLGSGPPIQKWLHDQSKCWFRTWRFVGARAAPVFDAAVVLSTLLPEGLEFLPCEVRHQKNPARLFITPAASGGRVRVAVKLKKSALAYWAGKWRPSRN